MATRPQRPPEKSDNYFWYFDDILGKGATGDVYKCREKETKKEFAVKVFNGHGMARPLKVTERELDVLNKLKDCTHENIVKVITIEEQSSTLNHAIVMELCTGGSLHTLLDQPENAFGFEESNFKQVVFDVVSGMRYLNDHDIIHRDIKPGNILQYIKDDRSFIYKLTDFGAARELAPEQQFMSIYGTEEYLHPDLYGKGVLKQSCAQKKFGASVDLWSLGATFYHVATGKLPFRPFGGRENRQMMFEITTKKVTGMISGIQKNEGGEIEWSDKLPEHTRLSPGLKEYIVEILGRLLESDSSKAMKFYELFEAVQRVRDMKVIHLFSAPSGTSHIIYASPDDNFARFQELIAIQTGVSARQQDLFYNNDIFKPLPSTRKVSTYPETTEEKPIFVVGGDSMASEKLFGPSLLKKTKLNANVSLENLDSDAVVSKVAATNVNWCLYTVKKLELSSILTLEVAENVITLLKRKARNYLTDAETIGRRCDSMVMAHEACLNGCQFEMAVIETLGTDDIAKEIIKEKEKLIDETERFKKRVETLRQDMVEPLQNLRTKAQTLLADGELAKKWRDMNKDITNEKYAALVENFTAKVEEIMKNFHSRRIFKNKLSNYDMDNHKFERLRLDEYFNKAKDAMDACQNRRQILHQNLRTWLEEVYDCRTKLKTMREEALSFITMFSVTLKTEEKWRADHISRMKMIVKSVRTQVTRAISVSELSSEQEKVEVDGRNIADGNLSLGLDFTQDISQKLSDISTETKEAKNCLQRNTEKFQRLIAEFTEGLNHNGVGQNGQKLES